MSCFTATFIDHSSWVAHQLRSTDDWHLFPSSYAKLHFALRSKKWDYWYLNFLLLWVVLLLFSLDGKLPFSYDHPLLIVCLVFMLLTQIPPVLGILYFIHFCNDMVLYDASVTFGEWVSFLDMFNMILNFSLKQLFIYSQQQQHRIKQAFVSVLLGQYIQYFYYGGQGRANSAGKCKKGAKRYFLLDAIKRILRIKSHAVVYSEEDEEEEVEEVVQQAEEDSDDDLEMGGPDPPLVEEEEVKPPPKEEKKKKKKKKKKEEEAEEVKEEEEEEEEPIAYTDWKCFVCLHENHLPAVTEEPNSDLYFGSRGQFYKQTFVIIRTDTVKPRCTKCFTYCNYQPPTGSAHMFPHNPNPTVAFGNYPPVPRVHADIPDNKMRDLYYTFRSFVFGLENSSKSALMMNDWKLRKFVADRFPVIPRVLLPPEQYYEVGEIIECRQQKIEWTRAKIITVKMNHTYDIRYDPGDEIRFVQQTSLRSRPEKRKYAYRVELCMAILVITMPLALLLGVYAAPQMLVIIPLLISITLLSLRVGSMIQNVANNSKAGLCYVMTLTMVYVMPLLFLLIACFVAFQSSSDPAAWGTVVALFILTKLFSLPVLYLMRPTFAVLGLITFIFSSASMYTVSEYMRGDPSSRYSSAQTAFAPLVLFVLFLKYVRYNLHNIWDVSLVIRYSTIRFEDTTYVLQHIYTPIHSFTLLLYTHLHSCYTLIYTPAIHSHTLKYTSIHSNTLQYTHIHSCYTLTLTYTHIV